MSLCTRNRWGTGSSYKPTNESKEMDTQFKKMMEERNKLDNIWTNEREVIEKEISWVIEAK